MANSFRANPHIDTETAVTQLGIGEALVSVLDAAGSPTPVEQTLIAPPEGQIGPISAAERTTILQRSPLASVYQQSVDRESAYELLKKKAEEANRQESLQRDRLAAEKAAQQAARQSNGGSRRQGAGEALVTSAARAIGSQLGRQILRGVLGSIFGKR